MGVSFYTCHNCGNVFNDCGKHVICESCGTRWCDEECAREEGYIEEHCSKLEVSGYYELREARERGKCEYDYCDAECEFYVSESCALCRGDDYEDLELLGKALTLLELTREELIEKMKAD